MNKINENDGNFLSLQWLNKNPYVSAVIILYSLWQIAKDVFNLINGNLMDITNMIEFGAKIIVTLLTMYLFYNSLRIKKGVEQWIDKLKKLDHVPDKLEKLDSVHAQISDLQLQQRYTFFLNKYDGLTGGPRDLPLTTLYLGRDFTKAEIERLITIGLVGPPIS